MATAMAALAGVLLSSCAAENHAPPFANQPYEAFSRSAAVAIALREWRLWGERVDDNDGAAYVQHAATMAERQQGLWQRVGEYWWEGLNANQPETRWTGKHDADGKVFPVHKNGEYAWSAAFISYVMRIAGAGPEFPYAADHSYYINNAAQPYHAGKLLIAENPKTYAPRLGDLVCFPRGWASNLTFAALPTSYLYPAHCSIVTGGGPGMVGVVGGNVDDSVTMEHLHANAQGLLAGNMENWFVVLRVLYTRN
ncbi:MAG: DUF2272 domain-containing protein [Rhodospirillales bacterium]|nr:DUF2272 domain-containing protein [Rhodospirillales bacterium]